MPDVRRRRIPAAREHPGLEVAVGLDRRRDGHAGLDHQLASHVDDEVPQERRVCRRVAVVQHPADQPGDLVGDLGNRRHRDGLGDVDERLFRQVDDGVCVRRRFGHT
jgi:hypothetical protein